MSIYAPKYGTLLTSKEVSELTGFTINQLRNNRQRKIGLPFVRQGGSSWYRKDDIEAWLDANGGADWEYIVPEGITTAPLENPDAVGERKAHLDQLAKITTKNAWGKWYGWLVEESGWGYDKGEPMWRGFMEHFARVVHGKELLDLVPEGKSLGQLRTANPIDYWPIMTYAMRASVAQVYGWDVSDEEIMAAPIGDNPPANGGF